jgi:hypothetical protein
LKKECTKLRLQKKKFKPCIAELESDIARSKARIKERERESTQFKARTTEPNSDNTELDSENTNFRVPTLAFEHHIVQHCNRELELFKLVDESESRVQDADDIAHAAINARNNDYRGLRAF